MTLAGFLVVIVWWSSELEEAIQRSFRLLADQSTVKIFSSEKNLITEPFGLIQFSNFLHFINRTSFILLVNRCLLPCASDVRPSCFTPLWIVMTLTALPRVPQLNLPWRFSWSQPKSSVLNFSTCLVGGSLVESPLSALRCFPRSSLNIA